jgi:hypothetical protein
VAGGIWTGYDKSDGWWNSCGRLSKPVCAGVVEAAISRFIVNRNREAREAGETSFRDVACRFVTRFEERFTSSRTVNHYLAIFERLIGGEAEPLAISHGVSVG